MQYAACIYKGTFSYFLQRAKFRENANSPLTHFHEGQVHLLPGNAGITVRTFLVPGKQKIPCGGHNDTHPTESGLVHRQYPPQSFVSKNSPILCLSPGNISQYSKNMNK